MSLLDRIDSIYFLLIPGWDRELRSNRWHFAVRWARIKPVVLVSPELRAGPAQSATETRIPNCRILRAQLVSEPNVLAKTVNQAGQVLEDMQQHGHTRPLLWCYDPELAELFARIPAMARVHHATEAFYEMPGRTAAMHRRTDATVTMSDLVVAVSEGVARSVRKRVTAADVVTITNGCDFKHYSGGKEDAELADAGHAYDRVAIYAGNINGRLDLALVRRMVEANPRTLFAFYGPVKELSPTDAKAWAQLTLLPNFSVGGEVDPDRLRDLYAAADVGLIPYRHDAWLVENGLPLKALEMAATGLPVVSTLMTPLLGLADALVVTSSGDEFLEALSRTSRRNLTSAEVAGLKTVSANNDYDLKFEAIVHALDERVHRTIPATAIDVLSAVLGRDWVDAQVRYARWLALPAPVRSAGTLAGRLALVLPAGLRRRLAAGRLRAAVRQFLGS